MHILEQDALPHCLCVCILLMFKIIYYFCIIYFRSNFFYFLFYLFMYLSKFRKIYRIKQKENEIMKNLSAVFQLKRGLSQERC